MKTYVKETVGHSGKGISGRREGVEVVGKKYTGPMFVKSTGKGISSRAESVEVMPVAKKTSGPLFRKGKGYDEGTAIRESEANSDEEASGRVESTGSGKRSARAAIVKKVMKDKGLSLIEASKYVKAHGLYKA